MALSTILKADFMKTTFDQALPIITDDRNRYAQVWEIIEEYCKKHQLIISNKYVLMQKQDTLRAVYEKQYKVYTVNPLMHANNLTNLIHQRMINEPNKKFIRMKTVKEQEEFMIDYDMRCIVLMYKLQKYKSTEPNNLIKPDYVNGLLYLPSEIELIDVYHDLYTMTKYDDNLLDEASLFQQVATRKEQGILGAASCKEKRKNVIESIKIDLVKDWLIKHNKDKDDNDKSDDNDDDNRLVLVGPWAYDVVRLTLDKLCVNYEKIQLIGLIDPEELRGSLQAYVSKHYGPFNITMREQDLNIPKDFRTSRFTYYVSIPIGGPKGTSEKPFLDLFNCANFEIIPYMEYDGLLLGNKWLVLRFLFIDLWIIRVIKTLGLLTDDILNKKLITIWNCIEYFRCDECESKIDGYIGIFRDYNIDKKIMVLNQDKRFFPYYPDIYIKDNGKYREIHERYEKH